MHTFCKSFSVKSDFILTSFLFQISSQFLKRCQLSIVKLIKNIMNVQIWRITFCGSIELFIYMRGSLCLRLYWFGKETQQRKEKENEPIHLSRHFAGLLYKGEAIVPNHLKKQLNHQCLLDTCRMHKHLKIFGIRLVLFSFLGCFEIN